MSIQRATAEQRERITFLLSTRRTTREQMYEFGKQLERRRLEYTKAHRIIAELEVMPEISTDRSDEWTEIESEYDSVFNTTKD